MPMVKSLRCRSKGFRHLTPGGFRCLTAFDDLGLALSGPQFLLCNLGTIALPYLAEGQRGLSQRSESEVLRYCDNGAIEVP